MLGKDFKTRCSARLAIKKPAMFQYMTAQAINLKKLKEKLNMHSIAMKNVAYKDGLIAHDLLVVTSFASVLDVAV